MEKFQSPEKTREFGLQPIDRVINERGLNNHAVVAASSDQLTHKMLAKARRGRWLKPAVRHKIKDALNTLLNKNFKLEDLFNYK
ncbi:MAG: hypothetical protein WCS73_06415 [Lentisphaeria bacterium]